MTIKIKICGITNYDDAKIAVSLGVDALGFIFYQKSPRYIHPIAARDIIRKLPPFVAKVGVFVDDTEETIRAVFGQCGIDTVQLHGNETPQFVQRLSCAVIKAFAVKPGFDVSELSQYQVAGYLLDTWSDTPGLHGGSGKTFDWSIACDAAQRYPNVILAGGLNPSNIRDALENVQPYAVEFNSGVEIKPGVKNHYKMRDAVAIVKNWNTVSGK
jgi:phosphoribosylanthranilate isomerase